MITTYVCRVFSSRGKTEKLILFLKVHKTIAEERVSQIQEHNKLKVTKKWARSENSKRRTVMRHIIRILTILSIVLFLNGFVTITDSISAKSTGEFKVYEKSYEVVWNALVDVVRTSELQLISEDSGSGQIVAREKVDALSYGEDVTIFVEKQESEAKIKVEIKCDATATFVSSQNWGAYILGKLDTKLR